MHRWLLEYLARKSRKPSKKKCANDSINMSAESGTDLSAYSMVSQEDNNMSTIDSSMISQESFSQSFVGEAEISMYYDAQDMSCHSTIAVNDEVFQNTEYERPLPCEGQQQLQNPKTTQELVYHRNPPNAINLTPSRSGVPFIDRNLVHSPALVARSEKNQFATPKSANRSLDTSQSFYATPSDSNFFSTPIRGYGNQTSTPGQDFLSTPRGEDFLVNVAADLTSTPFTPSRKSFLSDRPSHVPKSPLRHNRSSIPLKRVKSKRGLGPLMEASNTSAGISHGSAIPVGEKSDGLMSVSSHSVKDENFYEGLLVPAKNSFPLSPQHSRVFKNSQNIPSSLRRTGSSLNGLFIDGIKPLNNDEPAEHSNDSRSYYPREIDSSVTKSQVNYSSPSFTRYKSPAKSVMAMIENIDSSFNSHQKSQSFSAPNDSYAHPSGYPKPSNSALRSALSGSNPYAISSSTLKPYGSQTSFSYEDQTVLAVYNDEEKHRVASNNSSFADHDYAAPTTYSHEVIIKTEEPPQQDQSIGSSYHANLFYNENSQISSSVIKSETTTLTSPTVSPVSSDSAYTSQVVSPGPASSGPDDVKAEDSAAENRLERVDVKSEPLDLPQQDQPPPSPPAIRKTPIKRRRDVRAFFARSPYKKSPIKKISSYLNYSPRKLAIKKRYSVYKNWNFNDEPSEESKASENISTEPANERLGEFRRNLFDCSSTGESSRNKSVADGSSDEPCLGASSVEKKRTWHDAIPVILPSLGLNIPTNQPSFSNQSNLPSFNRSNQSNQPSFNHSSQSNLTSFSSSSQSNQPSFNSNNQSNQPSFNRSNQSNQPSFNHTNQSNQPSFSRSNQSNQPSFSGSNPSDLLHFKSNFLSQSNSSMAASCSDEPLDLSVR